MAALTADSRGLVLACPACGQANRIAYDRLTARTRCGRCQAGLPPTTDVVEVPGETEFIALTAQSTLPVFVDFWAPWCGPCPMVAQEVERLARLTAGEAVVAKLNTENVPTVAARFGIQSIPTFVVLSGGRELARTSGALPAVRLREWMLRSLT